MAAPVASPGLGLALARKLGALGCPIDVRSDALEALYGNPSMRLQGFLHWFVHALDDESSLPAQFDTHDRALVASIDLLDGAALATKEREVFGSLGDAITMDNDDDEDDEDDADALQEEIARLERQVAMETKKQTALRAAVATKRIETGRLLDTGLDMVAPAPAQSHSVTDAIDGLLHALEQTENALQLAFLSPTVCAHLSIREDKLLDRIQAQLMPLFRRPAPSGLETIPESPTRSSSVRWLHESLVDEMDLVDDAKEREFKACNAEFHRLVAAYPRSALHSLHTKLDATARATRSSYRQQQMAHALARARLMDPATLSATHHGLVSANASVVDETQTLLTDMLPLRLDELGRLQMTSIVLGDYKDKIDRQTRHLADQASILDTLERQSARLLYLFNAVVHLATRPYLCVGCSRTCSSTKRRRWLVWRRASATSKRRSPPTWAFSVGACNQGGTPSPPSTTRRCCSSMRKACSACPRRVPTRSTTNAASTPRKWTSSTPSATTSAPSTTTMWMRSWTVSASSKPRSMVSNYPRTTASKPSRRPRLVSQRALRTRPASFSAIKTLCCTNRRPHGDHHNRHRRTRRYCCLD
ncbi:hypothetical protein SDRG_12470 [Saprolegnia diclina VS20]|uniref:HAUS augmin-like complex subunit 3 N-terminal domain-containing protein n=1 Tax=Saprolegnia diclina (strain VS20) TaxID=1156394 RepID=T0PWP5_SAPDV|nr:hypothetical protein SDRG_12470 [Saprolegnia diclina VS20]EQC29924.1 hypothetical protein SDRG_12470 [Saprolegnia diclina VS20]|eukprot:XP_008616763.1 hypothetical protein SDRG_12470 [Saprolegnia diclina VS20]